jgi:cyclopropane fatty-acyl-phospholipid synthase-like methyltransferase
VSPRDLIQYLKYKYKNAHLRLHHDDPESLSYYRDLQNFKVQEGEAYPRGRGIGRAQFDFLTRMGIEPSNRIIDIGCGDLRGGRYIIEYVEKGNYMGIDISEEAIKRGWKNIKKNDLLEKSPSLRVNDDLRFKEFTVIENFNIVFANSVLTHLSEEYIAECFKHLDRVLDKEGQGFLSYNHASESKSKLTSIANNSNLYRYPFEELQELGSRHGYRIQYDDYNEHPNENMRMLVIDNND